ncbi:MAG: hypothetical protein KO464_02365 [Candidatus Methanofastidiosum sp.]|nr:hypothetical protein [Methanofastidiosum sp.]
MGRLKETDLAAPITEHLEACGWDVYKEVPCGSGVADILAVKDNKIWVVELKRCLSLQLLDQAIDRHFKTHYVSIAVPMPKTSKPAITSIAVNTVLNSYGIGVFMVKTGRSQVIEVRKPDLFRDVRDKTIKKLLASLHPKMKKNIAGSTAGNRWTPWKEWRTNVQRIVKANPGISPKEMVARLPTLAPYRKSKNAMDAAVYYARNGLLGDVVVRKVKGRLKLYLIHMHLLCGGIGRRYRGR